MNKKSMNKKNIALLAVIFFFLLATAAASWRRNPEQKPQPLENPQDLVLMEPEIPAPIDQGNDVEPEIRVFIAANNTIKTMKFEDYLKGVVAAEMDPTWPMEALAAQAIIARSFTLQKIAEEGGVPARGTHASTDIKEFQAYDSSRINDNVHKAVENTRGQVAVHGNQFIRGWFHAYAGPRTALAEEGLEFEGPNPPYIKIVDSPAEDVVPPEQGDWQASFPLDSIRRVTQQVTGSDPGQVTKVEIAEKGPSGRVTLFRVNNTEVSAPQMRLALDSTVMRSTYVDNLHIEGNSLVMEGKGYGHGVGMCQWGAKALATEGKSAEDIVRYYYRDVQIVSVWD